MIFKHSPWSHILTLLKRRGCKKMNAVTFSYLDVRLFIAVFLSSNCKLLYNSRNCGWKLDSMFQLCSTILGLECPTVLAGYFTRMYSPKRSAHPKSLSFKSRSSFRSFLQGPSWFSRPSAPRPSAVENQTFGGPGASYCGGPQKLDNVLSSESQR